MSAPSPFTATGIRLANVRVFEGEHVIPIDPGLTVLMGRNNAGKSTVLRAALLYPSGGDMAERFQSYCRRGCDAFDIGVQLVCTPADFEAVFAVAPTSALTVPHEEPVPQPISAACFSGWTERPLVEFATRAIWPSRAVSVTRFVGGEGTYAEAPNGDKLTARLRGDQPAVDLRSGLWSQAAVGAWAKFKPVVFFGYWEHERPERITGWLKQPPRRLTDTNEQRLQETLTFLRLKHPREFERVSSALAEAFPEFERLDFIDENESGFDYRPGFVAKDGSEKPLGRESIGSGAWTYLCILTAARAAKATAARVLLLDEPHLYLHPGLELRLIDELLDPEKWDGAPLQIVAATHSPTFVNAAVARGTLNILDWKDEARTSVDATTFTHEKDGQFFDALTSPPGDLLYADKIILVEGPSDVAPIRMLGRERCGLPDHVRFVAMREADAVKSEIARYFALIVKAQGTGFRLSGILLLDGDKRATVERVWDKLEGVLDPRRAPGLEVVFADYPLSVDDHERTSGNDLESLFCDATFLAEYFAGKCVDRTRAEAAIEVELSKIKLPSPPNSGKGCTAIRALHATLLGEQDNSGKKEDDLHQLTAFFIAHAEESWSAVVKNRLAPIEDALRRLARGERMARGSHS